MRDVHTWSAWERVLRRERRSAGGQGAQAVPAPPPQLMIPAEAAHNTITALGEVGMLQFKDLNADKSAFQRTYANQVRGRLRRLRGWSG